MHEHVVVTVQWFEALEAHDAEAMGVLQGKALLVDLKVKIFNISLLY